MSTSTIISLAALVVSIAAIIWVVRTIKRPESFTREGFAFRAMTAYLAFCITIVGSIEGKEGTFSMIVRVLRGLPEQPSEHKYVENIILLVIAVIPSILIYKFYANWAGAISISEHRREQMQVKQGILWDALDETRRLIHGKAREIHRSEAAQHIFPPLEIPVDTLAWRLQALDLITLRHPGYYFDVNRDWYTEGNCWIGELPELRQVVAVLCTDEDPSLQDVEKFLAYVRRAANRNLGPDDLRLWIAVKSGTVKATIDVGGISLQKYSEESLLDELVDFTYYFKHLKQRVEQHKLPDSDKTLADVYSPSRCLSEDGITHTDVEEYLRNWVAEPGQRQLALLGEYGQGKSTAALVFAHHLIEASSGKPRRVPILIELRGKSPRNSSPEEILAGWAYHYDRIIPKAVLKLIIAGRAILILDGFDEMALGGDAYARYAHFVTLWRFCYPKSKIIFTGRPNYFLDEQELKSLLGIDRALVVGPYCEVIRLEPFDVEQMDNALRAYSTKVRKEIISLAKSNPGFHDLVSRGSLLYVVGELWERGGLSDHGQNIDSASVMGLFIQSTYARQAKKADEQRDFMVLNTPERACFMSAIAYIMAAEKLPNQIAPDQFRALVERLFLTLPEEVSADLPASSTEPRTPLRVRLQNADDALDSVLSDVRTCAILVSDGSKQGALRFAHKSFMEYLAAEVLARQALSPHDLRNLTIVNILSDSQRLESAEILLRQPESLMFYAELIRNHETMLGLERDELSRAIRRVVFSRPRLREALSLYMRSGWVIGLLSTTNYAYYIDNIPHIVARAMVCNICCQLAGVPIRSSHSRLARRVDKFMLYWIGKNLPSLGTLTAQSLPARPPESGNPQVTDETS